MYKLFSGEIEHCTSLVALLPEPAEENSIVYRHLWPEVGGLAWSHALHGVHSRSLQSWGGRSGVRMEGVAKESINVSKVGSQEDTFRKTPKTGAALEVDHSVQIRGGLNAHLSKTLYSVKLRGGQRRRVGLDLATKQKRGELRNQGPICLALQLIITPVSHLSFTAAF